ncbi:MAG: hypothetical protein P4L33_04720 [Capsulimonadaceae bacterium]|nr:hypothetical protein [Capsulimonadaceae bacterium]
MNNTKSSAAKWLVAAMTLVSSLNLCIARADDAASYTAPIVRNDRMGTGTHFAFGANYEAILPVVASSGIGWIRDDLHWHTVEKTQGVYEIPERTRLWIKAVHASGLKLDLILNGGNDLYADHYDVAAYSRFAAEMARQLGSDVDCFEILNEPSNFGYRKAYGGIWNGLENDGTISPWVGSYVKLLNSAAEAIKAVRPNIKVIGLGSVTPVNIRQIAMGISPAVDGIVDHPYSYSSVPEILPFASSPAMIERDGIAVLDEKGSFASMISAYRSAAQRSNGPKEIWLTEFGYSTYQPEKHGLFAGFTRDAQAKYIQRRFVQALALGVNVTFQYDFVDDGVNPHECEQNFGLIDRQLRPKPAFDAVKRVAQATAGLTPCSLKGYTITLIGDDSSSRDTLQIYGFTDSARHLVFAIWSSRSASDDADPPFSTVKIQGVYHLKHLTALDLYTGKSTSVPFSRAGVDGVRLDRFAIQDHPVLLSTDLVVK